MTNIVKRSLLMAKILARKVVLEDGRPAFSDPQGKAAEKLVSKVDPNVFFDLFSQVFEDATASEVETLGKKSAAQASASPAASTTSPTDATAV
ncbi:hypothetical protein [Persicirhabdus sediminis]|uniref:hypothetical protein n=1 Tax=Persicirhabdus sediminis TaxID=454144 RepID=UPI001F202348|nr:hypothetical protein [Persicirhabdus sediminis]